MQDNELHCDIGYTRQWVSCTQKYRISTVHCQSCCHHHWGLAHHCQQRLRLHLVWFWTSLYFPNQSHPILVSAASMTWGVGHLLHFSQLEHSIYPSFGSYIPKQFLEEFLRKGPQSSGIQPFVLLPFQIRPCATSKGKVSWWPGKSYWFAKAPRRLRDRCAQSPGNEDCRVIGTGAEVIFLEYGRWGCSKEAWLTGLWKGTQLKSIQF